MPAPVTSPEFPHSPKVRRTSTQGDAAPTSTGSWFGALAEDVGGAADDGPASRYDWGTQVEGADSQFMTRQASRLKGASRSTVQRLYRSFLGGRALLALALLLAHVVVALLGSRSGLLAVVASVGYAVSAIAMWLVPRLGQLGASPLLPGLLRRQGLATIGVDLLVFSALHVLAREGTFNYAALLVLPVVMAGALAPRLVALGVASIATVVLLVQAVAEVLAGGNTAGLITQTGIAGIGFFLVALLMSELSARLAREELTSRGSLELARQQAQLNRLVIDEMQEGVLVVDRRGRVRASNPAARTLLAAEGQVRSGAFQLRGVPSWAPLVDAMEEAFTAHAKWPIAGRPISLFFEDGQRRQLQLRMRFTQRRDADASEDFCVLFIEDVRTVQARVRQEKLAAMGRVSAGIAHEIRNPLAAIAQANALLSEDAVAPAQRQLTQMVSDNVDRLKRIVDDVLEVAPSNVFHSPVIDLAEQVATICGDWAGTAGVGVGGDSALRVDLPGPGETLHVHFDPHHLRRVLVNLLDNAHRHGTGTRAATWVQLTSASGAAELGVFSDGPPIEAEVERRLFEPFFSTRSRGSGLGLYICRELCEQHGADIDFRPWPATSRYRNEFHVQMPLAPDAPTGSTLVQR